jgi:peptidoglycan hydrolase-like protein with peptidoglycan-binding domain
MQTGGKRLLRAAILTVLLLTFLAVQAWADVLPTLKLGSKGDAVYDLQENLKAKGYFEAKVITSSYTSALKKAVGVFQIANHINVPKNKLGIADEQTQNLAASPDAVTYPQYVEKLTDAQLVPGGSGTYVKKAQTRLKSLGYYSGKIDSKYRSLTITAVKDFQTANNLDSTGIAGSETRSKLYSTDPDNLPITRAEYDAANFITPLGVGASGDQVTQLQERLLALGYYWDEPDGNFDAQTKYSVKFFQEANGFSANGSASRTVRAKANTDTAVKWEDYTRNKTLIQLSAGCKPGVRVALLQLQLKNLGYYKGVITGSFTSSTTTAVRTFQIFNDMSSQYVTGKANTATRQKLLDPKAIAYDTVCGDDTLKTGDTGEAVVALQNKLIELG